MSSSNITMAAPADVYRVRRAKLAAQLDRPLVVFAGHAPARSYVSNLHRFRAACSYLYFGGPPLEDAILVIEPGSDGDNGCHLLRVPAGPDDALWLGLTTDDDALSTASGISRERIVDVEMLDDIIGDKSCGALIAPHPRSIAQAQEAGISDANDDEKRAVIELRLIKDEHEIAAMQRAADVAVSAHRVAVSRTRKSKTENDLLAAHLAELARHQCVPSFSPICTIRGEVLHGDSAGRTLKDGSLLLLDSGAEEPTGYCSDITRTWPATGKWTTMQHDLYETVLRAEQAAINACTPGKRYRDIHNIAALHICEGLVNAGLLRGTPSDLADRGAHGLFFAHGVGHLLGLGVHDLEEFGDLAGYAPGRSRPRRFGECFLRLDRDLEPGMVVTIEPGIYLVPAIWERSDLIAPFADVVNRPAIDQLLAANFGGIRIEDDVCVRAEGKPNVLTAALPKEVSDLNAAING